MRERQVDKACAQENRPGVLRKEPVEERRRRRHEQDQRSESEKKDDAGDVGAPHHCLPAATMSSIWIVPSATSPASATGRTVRPVAIIFVRADRKVELGGTGSPEACSPFRTMSCTLRNSSSFIIASAPPTKSRTKSLDGRARISAGRPLCTISPAW